MGRKMDSLEKNFKITALKEQDNAKGLTLILHALKISKINAFLFPVLKKKAFRMESFQRVSDNNYSVECH